MWFRISGLLNADKKKQHTEHCGVEQRGYVVGLGSFQKHLA
jgi:hypothetical protein